jgi:histidinol-phosphate aminotransferase
MLTGNFQLDVAKISSSIDDNTKIIFICSPNNPTANLINKEDILHLAESTGKIIVVDEAYIDFSSQKSLIYESLNYGNLIVLRTFSKAWGLAGIRAGYCTASKKIIEILYKIKAPYNLNSLTSHSIISAIGGSELKDKFVKEIIKERKRVNNKLIDMKGIEKVFDSETNYVLFKCNDASNIYNKLAERGVIIRDRSNQPLLENCLRVSIGTREQNDSFLQELSEVL